MSFELYYKIKVIVKATKRVWVYKLKNMVCNLLEICCIRTVLCWIAVKYVQLLCNGVPQYKYTIFEPIFENDLNFWCKLTGSLQIVCIYSTCVRHSFLKWNSLLSFFRVYDLRGLIILHTCRLAKSRFVSNIIDNLLNNKSSKYSNKTNIILWVCKCI